MPTPENYGDVTVDAKLQFTNRLRLHPVVCNCALRELSQKSCKTLHKHARMHITGLCRVQNQQPKHKVKINEIVSTTARLQGDWIRYQEGSRISQYHVKRRFC
jgi:hypothetical protein